MAFPASAMSRQLFGDYFAGTLQGGTGAVKWKTAAGDTFTAALYDNTVTGTKDSTAAAYAYGGTAWATGGGATGSPQVYQAGQWAQGGVNLANPAITSTGAGIVMGDADDTASGTACTISNAYGVFVYDNSLTSPVADQGICHNLFTGGAQSVTNGTLTIVWHTNGVWRVTV